MIPEVDRERVARFGFAAFVRLAWPHVEAAPLKWNWHLDEMCTHLEQLYLQRPAINLVINIPPGESKTILCSVLWPVWVWLAEPSYRAMTVTYDRAKAVDNARRSKVLLQSEWFRARWGDLLGKADADGHYYSTAGGERFATFPGGPGTGWHAHGIVVDDPVKAADARLTAGGRKFTAKLADVNHWWQATAATRAADPDRGLARCIVMQRLAEDDLTGFQLRTQPGTVVHLHLPATFEPENRCVTKFGGDRRVERGEMLNPIRRSRRALDKLAGDMGGWESHAAQAQLQQHPNPPSGSAFRASTFRRFSIEQRPFGSCVSVLSCDCTFKGGPTADNVALEVWGIHAGNFYCYLSDVEKRTFSETITAIQHILAMYPCTNLLVEDKANGSAVLDVLRGLFPVAANPIADKLSRASACSHYFNAGRVHFLENAPWYDRKASNLVRFPHGRHDDDVDATTQALPFLQMSYGYSDVLGRAMAEFAGERTQVLQSPDNRKLISFFTDRVV